MWACLLPFSWSKCSWGYSIEQLKRACPASLSNHPCIGLAVCAACRNGRLTYRKHKETKPLRPHCSGQTLQPTSSDFAATPGNWCTCGFLRVSFPLTGTLHPGLLALFPLHDIILLPCDSSVVSGFPSFLFLFSTTGMPLVFVLVPTTTWLQIIRMRILNLPTLRT